MVKTRLVRAPGSINRLWKPHLRFRNLPRVAFFVSFFVIAILALLCITLFLSFKDLEEDFDLFSLPAANETGNLSYQISPKLKISMMPYTEKELLHQYRSMDFVYSFVNGSEINYGYRKHAAKDLKDTIKCQQRQSYFHENVSTCGDFVKNYTSMFVGKTAFEVVDLIRYLAKISVSNRDRESDELRFSLRSVEEHIPWHTGRVMIVSPGHYPYWIDRAKNFFSSTCRKDDSSEGRHLRVINVHQDTILPYGMRLTFNSHTIEPLLFRLRNMTPIHVYFNDDYFVNRDVKVTDLLNEYGGPIIRFEQSRIPFAQRAAESSVSWALAVYHTNLFLTQELDRKNDELSEKIIDLWKAKGYSVSGESPIPVPSLTGIIDTAYKWPPEQLPETLELKTDRYFVTHAPFVYCTKIFGYISTRYEREYAFEHLNHINRRATDLLVPFLHAGMVKQKPWLASPQYLPYLLKMKSNKNFRTVDIALNNTDGCAPPSFLIGVDSDCLYAKFGDISKVNSLTMKRIDSVKPMFFNINAGFKSADAIEQLHDFMNKKFTIPSYLENAQVHGLPSNEGQYSSLFDAYDRLMRVPVVVIAFDEQGLCPLVRSLQLALPDHKGPLILVNSHADLSKYGSLGSLQEKYNFIEHNSLPVIECQYDTSRIKSVRLDEALSVSDIANKIPLENVEPVTFPPSCGFSQQVSAIVIDSRGNTDFNDIFSVREALGIPGQSLSLDDFDTVKILPKAGINPQTQTFALVLARAQASEKSVHWITGGSERDLLLSYPLPYERYEDMNATISLL